MEIPLAWLTLLEVRLYFTAFRKAFDRLSASGVSRCSVTPCNADTALYLILFSAYFSRTDYLQKILKLIHYDRLTDRSCENNKFISAEPSDNGIAEFARQRLAYSSQHLVAETVSVCIVERLEVVNYPVPDPASHF